MRIRALMLQALLVAGSAGMPAATIAAAADASPKDIIAAQIHAQGYTCNSPQSAEQDAKASKPDEAVWVLQCEDAKYRVRLVPDMAAKVESIDQ